MKIASLMLTILILSSQVFASDSDILEIKERLTQMEERLSKLETNLMKSWVCSGICWSHNGEKLGIEYVDGDNIINTFNIVRASCFEKQKQWCLSVGFKDVKCPTESEYSTDYNTNQDATPLNSCKKI
jgi:hypothetical protein